MMHHLVMELQRCRIVSRHKGATHLSSDLQQLKLIFFFLTIIRECCFSTQNDAEPKYIFNHLGFMIIYVQTKQVVKL